MYAMKPLCVVVVLLSCIHVSYTCPSVCSCSGIVVDCTTQNLTEIPSGIPASTQILHLNNNQITDINPQIFKGLSALIQLSLQDNKITIIGQTPFEGLPALRSFDLHNNQITYIGPQTFDDLSDLQYLFLDGNPITNILPQTFDRLSALSVLDLEFCPLDCSSCDLEALKVFLNNQTQLGNAYAVCSGTNTYVVNHDFENCIDHMTTTDDMTTLVDNITNNRGSSEDSSSITTENLILIVVGSVGALAVVIGISVGVSYACCVKKRKGVVPMTI